MKILHTEASMGFGGQELRILREAEGMRDRGHEIVLAVIQGGTLAVRARESGFIVYELPFQRKRDVIRLLWALRCIIKCQGIQLINTHSSWDAWIGGLAARLAGCHVVRTRHLSTPTRPGLNSRLLFRTLADAVVTTCEQTAQAIREQVQLTPEHCQSVPTGMDARALQVDPNERRTFREQLGLAEDDIVVGTVCVLRRWKGVIDLIQAAKLLEGDPRLKWLVVGDGPSRQYFERHSQELGLANRVLFTGYLTDPRVALASMDLFLLLSTEHEGVSQACLQAAYLQRPLITTPTGGLAEVCLDGENGFLVPVNRPDAVANRVERLANDAALRLSFGQQARKHVEASFTLKHTLDAMEAIYGRVVTSSAH